LSTLTWTAYLLMACEGFLIYAIGFITPFVRHDLDVPAWLAALPNSALALGLAGAGVVAGSLNARVGPRVAIRLWAWLMAASSVLLAIPLTIVPVLLGALLFGASAGGTLVHVNSALGTGRNARSALVRATLWSTVGGLVAPLVLSAAESTVGWRVGPLAPMPILVGLALVLPPSPARDRSPDVEPDVEPGVQPDVEPRMVRDPARPPGVEPGVEPRMVRDPARPPGREPARLPRDYWRTWLFMTLLIGAEFSFVVWAAQVVAARVGIDDAAATGLASLYVAGMTGGRLALATGLSAAWGATVVLRGGTAIAVVGAVCIALASGPELAGLGLLLGGIGTAPAYPLGAGLALAHAPGAPVRAARRLTAASGVAIFSMPLALGLLVGVWGVLGAWLAVLAMLGAGLIAIIGVPPAPDTGDLAVSPAA
jgi:MFS family permease